jgi:heme exporter protein CcmD
MTATSARWFWYASPQTFYPLAGAIARWCGIAAAILAAAGLWIGLVAAPTDAQQGDAYRIIFIHVAAAWMSMFLYVVMAFWAAVGLAFNTRLSGMLASAIAPTGALFTFIALWTGSLWGKPTWGTYWVWDARLTSELILLFLYFGFIALQAAIDDPRRPRRRGARAGRRGEHPDHLFLGAVVEHAAPGRFGQPEERAEHGADHAEGDAGHGARVLGVRHRGRDGAGALHHPRERRMTEFFAMGGYGWYVWGSYGVTFACLALEVIFLAKRNREAKA